MKVKAGQIVEPCQSDAKSEDYESDHDNNYSQGPWSSYQEPEKETR